MIYNSLYVIYSSNFVFYFTNKFYILVIFFKELISYDSLAMLEFRVWEKNILENLLLSVFVTRKYWDPAGFCAETFPITYGSS